MTRSHSAVALLTRIRKRNPSLWERIVQFRADEREIEEMADQLFEQEISPARDINDAIDKVLLQCKKDWN